MLKFHEIPLPSHHSSEKCERIMATPTHEKYQEAPQDMYMLKVSANIKHITSTILIFHSLYGQ